MAPLRRVGHGLELRWTLSAIIGLLLIASLLLAASISIRSAQQAVRDEVGSSLRTAQANLDVTLKLLEGRPQAEIESALALWSAAYAGGRHLCVAIERQGAAQFSCRQPTNAAAIPSWFAGDAADTPPPFIRTVDAGSLPLRILIVSDPHDELREAWSEVRRLLLLTAVLAIVVCLGVFAVVSRALSPLQALVSAMDRIGRGDHPGPLPRGGAPEIRRLSRGLLRLSGRLRRSRDALRAMHLRHLELQEEERRMVSRELHDEIGQHVAAIEMETIRIGRLDADAIGARRERLTVLRGLVAEIHRVSRRVIERLRPPSIERLGLVGALEALFDRFRADHPQIALHAVLEPGDRRLTEDRAIHLFRIVQESLTNIARHAAARNAWIRLVAEDSALQLRIIDDGRGFDPHKRAPGYGLIGLRERVDALNGTLSVHSAPGSGTTLEIALWLSPVKSGSCPVAGRSGPVDSSGQHFPEN